MQWSWPVHAGVSDDGDLLVRALAPEPGARILALSAHGAGESALTLLAHGAEVVAHDVADALMLAHLLRLKLSAAQLFGREDYLVLMGLRPATTLRRSALAKRLLVQLPDGETRAFWQKHEAWLQTGLFFSDRIALFVRSFLLALRALAPEDARRTMLFAPRTADRVQAFRRHVKRPWLERVLAGVGGRVNLFFPEAEWRASEYPRAFNRDPLGYLETLIAAGLADNPLFAHLVRPPGQPLPEPLLPPHLRPGRYDGLVDAASRLTVVPVGRAGGRFSGAYLSNVIDYLLPEARERLFSQLCGHLRPGAPVLVYSNESYPKVPRTLPLDHDLRAEDRARIYRRVELYRTPVSSPHLEVVG